MKKTEFGLEYLIQNQHTLNASQRRHLCRTISTRNPEVVLAELGTVKQLPSVDTSGITISGGTGAGWVLFPEAATGTGLVDTSNLSILASSRSSIQKYGLQERGAALTRSSISTNISIAAVIKSSIVNKAIHETGTARSRSEIFTDITITGYRKDVVVRGNAREYENSGCTDSRVQTDQITITAKVT